MPIDGSDVRVSLHCHSSLSDGELPPAALAERLAAEGVRYAALTDHDTVEGLSEFRAALLGRGVGVVDGVELTAAWTGGEVHILGYGFDPSHAELLDMLERSRRQSDDGMQGLVDSMRHRRVGPDGAPSGYPSVEAAVRTLHAAGGTAFIAHPLSYGLDMAALEEKIPELKAAGLDGLEAVYGPYDAEQIRGLCGLADRHGLAVSGGADYHGPSMATDSPVYVPLAAMRWSALRSLILRAATDERAPARLSPGPDGGGKTRGPVTAQRRFAARIAIPTITAIALFTLGIFALVIPGFERILLDRKKDTIRELTASAVSILREYYAEESAGRMSRAQAQAAAAARIRDLRYGAEGKDYFWITDMRPVMVMHPYRAELDGTDVSGYADANGVRVFVEFVKAVSVTEEGYVEYLWQWKDDSHRIVPKLSYVKRFPPWDWVVGTGIYLEDVNAEILRVSQSMILLSAGIAATVALLLVFIAHQSLGIERRRLRAESALQDSHERYKALVEAAREGMAVVISGVCSYANPTFLSMLGYSEAELPLLEIAEILRPYPGEAEGLRAFISSLEALPDEEPRALECILSGRAGREIDVVVNATRLALGGRAGTILVARDASMQAPAAGAAGARGIRNQRTDDVLRTGRMRLMAYLRGLESAGTGPRDLCRILTVSSDVLVRTFVEAAVAELGVPPAPFAFLALGSEGRGENVPGSDQDNAIIFVPASGDGLEAARSYFLRLAESVNGRLDGAGIPFCTGGVMAMNRPWCATLEEWRGKFAAWIGTPEPREIMSFDFVFDLRCVSGDAGLAESLLSSVRGLLRQNPPFLPLYAKNELDRRLPVFQGEGALDTKLAMAPIVSFARLYALQHGVKATGTLERLEAVRDSEALDRGSIGEAIRIFDFFLRLRIGARLSGGGNEVDVRSLSPDERDRLKDAVSFLDLLRKKMGWDFLGTVL